jgi:hypothetical protein
MCDRNSVIKRPFALFILLALFTLAGPARGNPLASTKPRPQSVRIPHATFAKIHIGMSEDSVLMVFRALAKRKQTFQLDSMTYIETDSITVFDQPAYLQAQLLHHRVRTVVINFHPLSGDRYLNVRDQVDQYMVNLFGRGIEESEESMTHHRWETEEGTMEVSHSDKYTRVFIRLGKPRV